MSWDLRPIFSDADMEIRKEIREMIKDQDRSNMKKIVTEEEYMTRRRLNLPCDGYLILQDFAKRWGIRVK